ncbi:hypothetical protein HY230_04765, partial [Candidatus Acetothermia bacterium]|nr:hypothetical protein [Candidatus Acetothermia bacterium]
EGASLASAALFRVDRQSGNVYADGAYFCGSVGGSGAVPPCFNANVAADIAEHIDASERLEDGDVVEIDPANSKNYRKAQTPYSRWVAGVVSSHPGVVMATKNRVDTRVSLALAGWVLVKATTENGPIRPGDLLVSSSRSGYAMRCTDIKLCEGAIIGKALESLVSREGSVMILVMSH